MNGPQIVLLYVPKFFNQMSCTENQKIANEAFAYAKQEFLYHLNAVYKDGAVENLVDAMGVDANKKDWQALISNAVKTASKKSDILRILLEESSSLNEFCFLTFVAGLGMGSSEAKGMLNKFFKR